MTTSVTVFKGKSNTCFLFLKKDGEPIPDHTVVTRLKIRTGRGNVVVDSQVNPEFFDFTNTDKIVLKLGMSSIPEGNYESTVTVYDSLHVDGLAWTPKIRMNVIGESSW